MSSGQPRGNLGGDFAGLKFDCRQPARDLCDQGGPKSLGQIGHLNRPVYTRARGRKLFYGILAPHLTVGATSPCRQRVRKTGRPDRNGSPQISHRGVGHRLAVDA
jgi:hypothetical protein